MKANSLLLKRVVLATGGTGGHIFPALAVAHKIREEAPDIEILFVGGKYGQEKKWVSEAGFSIYTLPVKGIMGKGVYAISGGVLLVISLIRCFIWLKKIRPRVVAGFGSYASFAPVYLATWMNIPTCIHEQNSYPGFTNRFLAKRVDKVFLSFPDENGIFGGENIEVVGSPVREEIIKGSECKNGNIEGGNKRINLLVIGGSQGAKAINDAVINSLPLFKKMGIKLYHQTGKMDYDRVLKAYRELNMENSRVVPFISCMAEAYCWADLVVCRAGASTIFELAVMGKPSILIPYPYAAADHQRMNASFLEKKGGAMVVNQSFLREKRLGNIVADLVAIPGKLKEMSRAAKSLAKRDAAEKIAKSIIEMGFGTLIGG